MRLKTLIPRDVAVCLLNYDESDELKVARRRTEPSCCSTCLANKGSCVVVHVDRYCVSLTRAMILGQEVFSGVHQQAALQAYDASELAFCI
jgi:hypothetical protein